MIKHGSLDHPAYSQRDGNRRYHIVLADNHKRFREWLKRDLADRNDIEVVGEAVDGRALLGMLGNCDPSPDMVIVDISMPNLGGIDASQEIKRLYPGTKILMMTVHNEKEYLGEAIAAGADGYVLKDTADFLTAIDTVRKGKMYVSPSMTG